MPAPIVVITKPGTNEPVEFATGSTGLALRTVSDGLATAIAGAGRVNPVYIRGVIESVFNVGVRIGHAKLLSTLPPEQRVGDAPAIAMGNLLLGPGARSQTAHQLAEGLHGAVHSRRAGHDPRAMALAVLTTAFRAGYAAGADPANH